ncbi:hypothetical protein JMK10_20175 [Rhodovulum sulfidophilum]|uniref:hypothetical protein n=1 Tax=Rhodovulum sulfidophilum TaxID=35806 RepID=UPI0019235C92|nr:hypothetical protein [Rhodovulum sulfidophilum]MBL3575915.1 hypothetical protein [Rhodovulum sulfidophilum]MCE8432796.1 hypothetical protein [Rhodovulum sulfidophilum]MCF4119017.1 hypothetical protein [Rhodovulum sulfidophilum]
MGNAEFKHAQLPAAAILLALPCLLALTLSKVAGPFSWDDGAITLAYGRTLFASGEFALNALSPRTEGTSSLLYALLNGGVIHALDLGFHQAIDASRLISALFLGATAALLFSILQKYVAVFHAFIISVLYCLLPVNYIEVFNGMEMLAFGFLLLLYLHLLQNAPRLALFVLPFVILVRIEAGFYLVFVLGLAFLLDGTESRSRYLQHLLATALLLFSLEIFRHFYFGSLIPNTVVAKTNPPYSLGGMAGLDKKISGFGLFLSYYFTPTILAFEFFRSRRAEASVLPNFILIFAFGLFALLSGRNWGYDARMTLALLPPTLVALASADCGIRRDGSARFVVPVLAMMLTLISHTIAATGSMGDFLASVRNGKEYTDLKRQDTSNLDIKAPYSHGMYGVTPENYRITGEAVQALGEILGVSPVTFASPDVGGLGLCSDRVSVIDTAMLTNPDLARRGYRFFGDYISRVRPDIIETHGMWSKNTRIYDEGFFNETYRPVIFRNTLLHVRNDHIRDLSSKDLLDEVDLQGLDWKAVRYGSQPIDQEYVLSRGKLMSIRARPQQMNGQVGPT